MSTMTVSTSSSVPSLTASNATLAGSAPSRSDRTTVAPTREPQVCSWSAAAARNVSAAPSSTVRPSPISTRASLPQVVVLPVPLTPTISSTAGRPACGADLQRPVQVRPDRPRSAGPAAATGTSLLPVTLTSVRSCSTRCRAGATPMSAVIRVSSISSQACVVERVPRQQAEQHRAERRLRPGQPAAEPDHPARRRRRDLDLRCGGLGDGLGGQVKAAPGAGALVGVRRGPCPVGRRASPGRRREAWPGRVATKPAGRRRRR